MSRLEYYSIFYNYQGYSNSIAWFGSALDIYIYTEPNKYMLGKREMPLIGFSFHQPLYLSTY